jgi:branched-chain amino acid transport system substrate-binding protein
MQLHGWLIGAATALVGLAASPAAPLAQETYDIHVIQALTGGGAFLGKQEQEALQIEEPVLNAHGGVHGKKVHFIFHDDQSSPQIAVQLTQDVLALHPQILLGSSLVATCNAMAPLVANGPVTYCFSAGIHPPAGSYMFTSSVSTEAQAEAMLHFFREKGWVRFVSVTSTDATGQDADQGFDKLMAKPEFKDLTLAERVHFNITDVSAAAQIERLKASNAQAWIGWSTGSPIATVWRGAVQSGLDLPSGTTGGNMTYAQMRQFANFLPKELYFPSAQFPIYGNKAFTVDPGVAQKQKEMFEAFAALGNKPDEGSVLSWDPAVILVELLNKLPEGASPAEIRDRLQHLKGQPGVSGLYDYEKTPQRGLSLENCVVSRWDAATERWDVVASMAESGK